MMANIKKLELINALQLHENVLHAEEQAIQAKDLATIEQVASQKDHTLDLLARVKETLDNEGVDFSDLQKEIDEIINKQERNTELFRDLHIQSENSSPPSRSNLNSLKNRMRKAYKG
jgi:hypothetical protein